MSWNYPDGRKVEPWGKPAGRITYDADGNVPCLCTNSAIKQMVKPAIQSAAELLGLFWYVSH
jgi:hypothetical protein